MLYAPGEPEMLRSLIGVGLTKEFVGFCKIKIVSICDILFGNYSSNDYNCDLVYFSLKRLDGKYELVKIKRNRYHDTEDNNTLKYSSGKYFDYVKLFEDIIVFKDSQTTYVYNYEENLLKTFSK